MLQQGQWQQWPLQQVGPSIVDAQQKQYSVFDPGSNKTIVWSRFTPAECAHGTTIPAAAVGTAAT